jgi:YegS/Rv2252/BmrU family lipid kinase
MTSVAVLAHSGKSLGGGLQEFRHVLAEEGVSDPLWFEVPKSKKAPKMVKAALEEGADLLFIWGGDGMVQRCIDALDGEKPAVAIIPAGTANLLAKNLGIPHDIGAAVRVGLHGQRRALDTGVVNGERFAVMAGVGIDALMIRDADAGLKDRVGRLAYIVSGAKHLRDQQTRTKVKVDDALWFKGRASCVLFGNVGKVLGGMTVFPNANPNDGRLEVGVVTAKGLVDWGRAVGRTMIRDPEGSPFVRTASGGSFDIRLDRKVPYELDGGDRPPTERLRVSVEPASISICVPEEDGAS